MLTTQSQILTSVLEKLTPAGRFVDTVTAVQQLLALASEVGQIRCTLAGENCLRFELPEGEPFDVPHRPYLAKSNLRSMCARIAVLRQESGQEFEPYGGEGVITRQAAVASYARYLEWLKEQGSSSPAGRNGGAPPRGTESAVALDFPREKWKVRYKNNMGQQEFTITAE
jgi:hypothetical protein